MIEVKNNFNGGLNLDDSPYLIPNSSYINALNVTRDAIEGSNDRSLTNIVGNQIVPYIFTDDVNITTETEYYGSDGETIVLTTFSGADFIPPGYRVRMYVSGTVLIAEYTTIDTISINSLLSNLCVSIINLDVVNSPYIDNGKLRYQFSEGDYTPGYTVLIDFQNIYDIENKCIGSYSDNFRNTVIYFVWSASSHHTILEYDNSTRSISPIFINLTDSNNLDVLGFTKDDKINNINVYHRNLAENEGDILFFLDSLGRPTVMDILRFKNKEYAPVTRDIIDVAKRPPLIQPACSYGNDISKPVNSIKDKLFRFKYRYIYDNNEKSTCSPISSVSLPIKITDPDYTNIITNNNLITVALNSGDRDVKAVELLMSYVNKTNDWSDFSSVDIVQKDTLGLRSSYTITTPPPDPTPSGISTLNISFSNYNSIGQGTVIEIYFNSLIDGGTILAATYTALLADNITNVINGLIDSCNDQSIGYIHASVGINPNEIVFDFSNNYDGGVYGKWAFNSIVINNQNDLVNFSYSFYNDGTYPVIDVNESIQLFDYVPEKANAQEMPNGNVLLYGGITEGYDRALTPNVVNEVKTNPSGVSTIGQLSATWRWDTDFDSGLNPDRSTVNFITFSGNPLAGTTINYWRRDDRPGQTTSIKGTYLTVVGDTASTVASRLLENIISQDTGGELMMYFLIRDYNIFLRYRGNDDPGYAISVDRIEIIEPATGDSGIPTFLYSTQRKLGIAYFDKKGKTNGILYSGEIKFPAYDENAGEMLLPYINTKIYHKPPEWAYSYGMYLTKENTQFLYWQSTNVKFDNLYYYFDITNIEINQSKTPTKSSVLSWSFQDGDRLRLIKRIGASPYNVYGDIEVAIVGIIKNPGNSIPDGLYAKVLKTTDLDTAIDGIYTSYLIQLFRNNQQQPGGNNEVYYEFGQNYLIGNPTLPSRYHIGMVTDQGIPPTFRNDFQSVGNRKTIQFSGTVLPGTSVIITNSYGGGAATLASYISAYGDSIQNIVEELTTQLGTWVSFFSSVSNPSINSIRIILNIGASVQILDSDIKIILPSPESIPAEFNFYNGDVYFKTRSAYISNYDANVYTCLDRNFVDDYNSAVNSIDGRSNIVDINAKNAYYSTLVRFSNAYQANTNVNGTNRFYPNNFDEYDYSFGDIMRFKVRDRFVRVFQKNKVGQVPLYHQILKEQNKESLVVSDRLLNPIQYYMGDVGIGDNPESLASYNFADYFTSNKRGVICRVSNNGVEFISSLYKINSWTTEQLPYRTGNYKVYGAFDNRLGDYIIALEATDTKDPYTIMFDEELNSFSTFLSYHPEMMTCLNTLLVTFKNGQLWTHDSEYYNTFYDIQSESSITTVFNQNPLDKKTFLSVSQISSGIWVADQIDTDIVMYGNAMQSSLIESDFDNLEGTYEAAILRDSNSPGGIANGDVMKGKYMVMKFSKYPDPERFYEMGLIKLNSLSLKYINSPLNSR